MVLKEFEYIDQTVELLEDITPQLNNISNKIQDYFEVILLNSKQEYLNISSRVKASDSLREKIIRNRYLNKYKTPISLIQNLSDLIGIRVECRFIEEEKKIYKILKSYFNKTDDNKYYYNKENHNIRIRLDKEQPQRQKNGFEIYRIDGEYRHQNQTINFEIQIKSMVNLFWSDIEHKVIYKNNAYVIVDKFLGDILSSVKANLTMLDNQLLSIHKNFVDDKKINNKEKQMQMFISKITYDTFASKMEKDIGFIVDFKKPCETIINYSFNKNKEGFDIGEDATIKALMRINEIANKDIDFNSKIRFGKMPEFEDEFCEKLGGYIITKLNCEFIWNLFFKILFEIEPLNQKEDFENFILFIKEKIISLKYQAKIEHKFTNKSKFILNDIYMQVVNTLINIDTIEILFNENLDEISFITRKVINDIYKNIQTYEEYLYKKEKYMNMLSTKIEDIF